MLVHPQQDTDKGYEVTKKFKKYRERAWKIAGGAASASWGLLEREEIAHCWGKHQG